MWPRFTHHSYTYTVLLSILGLAALVNGLEADSRDSFVQRRNLNNDPRSAAGAIGTPEFRWYMDNINRGYQVQVKPTDPKISGTNGSSKDESETTAKSDGEGKLAAVV